MAICLKTDQGHLHDEPYPCDEAVANGRTTTVMAVRISDDKAKAIRRLMANSPLGYGSVNELINHLIDTQLLRTR